MSENKFELIPPPPESTAASKGDTKFVYFVTYEFTNGVMFSRGNTYVTLDWRLTSRNAVEHMCNCLAKSLGVCPRILVILNFQFIGTEHSPRPQEADDAFPPEDDGFELAAGFLDDHLDKFAEYILQQFSDITPQEAGHCARMITEDLWLHSNQVEGGD